MEEIWKDVPGYKGLYQVSNLGNIKALEKQRSKTQPHIISKEKPLKPGINVCGYKFVILVKNQEKKSFLLHRLILSAFIPNPENKPCANHKDCDRNNNRIENLEWCTYKENTRHAMQNGRMDWTKACKGSKHGRSKLTEADALAIKKRLKLGEDYKDIAADYPVCKATIYLIMKVENWGWLSVE